MSTDKNKEIVSAFFENSNKGDMDSSIALLSDDLVWTGVGTTRFSGVYQGKDTVMSDLVGPLFGNLKKGIHMTIQHSIAEGDHVVLQASGQAETVGGAEYNNTYCFIFKISDGKICEVVEYSDTALIDKVFG